MKISEYCLKRPVFAIVLNVLVILAGIIAYRSLTVREYPNVTNPVVNIETSYFGASAEIIESEITRPIEDALSSIEGIDYLSSTSNDDQSHITLVFRPGRDIDSATNDIRDAVGRVRSQLPKDIEEPTIAKMSADADAIIWLAFTSSQHSLLEMSEYVELHIKDRLASIPGVAGVMIAGERKPSMRIWLDPLKMASYQITVQDVSNALHHQNIALPAGRLESDNLEFTVNAKSDLKDVAEFENIILREDGGYLLQLKDIAKIELGPKNERFLARFNGQPSVGLGIIKQSTANPLDISKILRKQVPALEASLPKGMNIVVAYDSTIVIKESIRAVYKTIIEAMVLVILIIFLFLRSARATLIPLVTIPIAIIGGFALMKMWGFSINTLTLLAMVLAVGLVVDDAIVVLENIFRHIEEGEKPMDAAVKGMREIGPAVIAMTLTLVSVFAPIAFAEGKIGKLFTEFAVVLAGTVVISGFTALTLTPVMCAKLLKHETGARNNFYYWVEDALSRVTQGYRRALKFCFAKRKWVLGGIGAVLVLNILCFSLLKSEMMPAEDRGFIISIGMAPTGSSIDYTTKYALEIEPLLLSQPEVDGTFLIIGYPNVQQAISFSLLKPWEKRKKSQQDIVAGLGGPLWMNPGLMAFAINPPSSLEQDVLAGQIALVIQSSGSYENLDNIANAVIAKARAYPGIQNLNSDLKLNKPQINLTVNREKAAQSGVDVDTIGQSLQILFGGMDITQFKRNGKKYDVIVQSSRDLRRNPADLTAVMVKARNGTMVPLSSFIEPELTTTATSLNHFNKLPAVVLSGAVTPGYSLGETLAHLEKLVKEVEQEHVQIDYSGASRAFMQSSGALYFTFALALFVVFLVLAAQFESFKNPLVIMFSVPLGILGALIALKLAGGSLNIFSQIGLITLIGLITKHGILIVDFASKMQKTGFSVDEAIIEATTLRLRPILMTTAAMVLGAIPLALASGAGAESRQQIGWAIVGGLTIGTFLTLFVVPIVYRFLVRDSKHGEFDEVSMVTQNLSVQEQQKAI